MPRQNVGQAEMLATLHVIICEKVKLAVRPFVGQETTCTEAEMVNHIVHYIYKASSSQDLLSMPWKKACQKLVRRTLKRYWVGCEMRELFWDLPLADCLSMAAWQLLGASSAIADPPGPTFQDVQDVTTEEYKTYLDESLLQTGIMSAVVRVFPDHRVWTKVNNALRISMSAALDDALQRRVYHEVMTFMATWISDGLERIWTDLGEDKREVFSEEALSIELLRKLMKVLKEPQTQLR